MSTLLDYRPGESFSIQSEGWDCEINRKEGHIRICQKRLLRKSQETTFPLSQLEAITVYFSDAPSMSFRAAAKLLRDAVELAREGEPDGATLLSRAAKGILVKFRQSDSHAPATESVARFGLAGLSTEDEQVDLGFRIADAAGLAFGAAYSIPGAGVEVHLSRQSAPHLHSLERISTLEGRKRAVSTALLESGAPPFIPSEFKCRYKVEEWDPSRRVVFKRPFRIVALLVFPFTLLLLLGPGLVTYGLIVGRQLNVMNILVLSLLAAMFGIPALGIFLGLLPSKLVFDWSSQNVLVKKFPRSKTIPFSQIEALELRGEYFDSSDNGRSARSFFCQLEAIVDTGNGNLDRIVLLESEQVPDRDLPFRQGVPLVRELARAIDLEGRVRNYSFRESQDLVEVN